MLVAWPVLKCLQTTNKPVAEVFTDSWSNAWDVWAARLSLTRGAPPRGDLLPKRCHTGRLASVEHTARAYTTSAPTYAGSPRASSPSPRPVELAQTRAQHSAKQDGQHDGPRRLRHDESL